ncbi:MAG: pilus assembly protein N-terminal domain-containing protein [Maricaulaceae bacterium]
MSLFKLIPTIALFSLASVGWADPVSIHVDHASVVRLAQPATGVVLGNPSIAGVSVQDSKTLVVTGRSPGQTNLLVLNDSGAVMLSKPITVTYADTSLVTLSRGPDRRSFLCNPDCDATPAVGDEVLFFDAVTAQKNALIELGRGGEQGQGQQ